MLLSVLLLGLVGGGMGKLTCPECVVEMHKLGVFVKEYGPYISKFLAENYCPTVNSPDCEHHLEKHYVTMLGMVTNHFIVDGAMHICQMMMTCEAKTLDEPPKPDFSCRDCVEKSGLGGSSNVLASQVI